MILEKRKESWPEDQRDWPQQLHISFLERFPFTDGEYSWWPIVQVVPKEGTELKLLLGIASVAFCMVQIVIIDFYKEQLV